MFSCFTIETFFFSLSCNFFNEKLGQCNSPGLSGKDGLSESFLKDLLHGSEYVLTYEDKDGDWSIGCLWKMFLGSMLFTDICRKLRIMNGLRQLDLTL
ncbi:hypothetical protein HN51_004982 [Arachis hypogaea]